MKYLSGLGHYFFTVKVLIFLTMPLDSENKAVRTAKPKKKLSDFVLCHDQDSAPFCIDYPYYGIGQIDVTKARSTLFILTITKRKGNQSFQIFLLMSLKNGLHV